MVLFLGKVKGIGRQVLNYILGLFKLGRVYLFAAFLLFISVSVLILNQFIFWSISAGDNSVVLVKNRSLAKEIIDQLLAEQAGVYGCPVFFKQNVEIKPVWGINCAAHCCSRKDAVQKLHGTLDYVIDAAAIVINGKEKIYVADTKTGWSVLGAVKDKYRPRGVSDVRFEEKVELVHKQIPPENLLSKQEAFRLLSGSSGKVKIYEIKEGDTLWDIARLENMDLNTLIRFNPNIKPQLLNVGQKIHLNVQEPVLNVVSRYEVVNFIELPYTTIEIEDSNLDYGEIKVTQQGVPGKMEITYCVVEKNGKKIDKYPVKELIKQKPRPQIVAAGSKMVLASRSGRGVFRPVIGSVSSVYGMRSGKMHGGIDFAAALGSPVVAMMAGTVEFKGYKGGYGLAVDINHGNGMVTRYAHLSAASVSVGEEVRGGELIGHVGSTGNSTGPHLHFEVRVNGETRDPAGFL